MYKIKLYNNIAQKGLDRFNDQFEVGTDVEAEDAIIVRSANLHDLDYKDTLKAIARAGAGVNNIDLDACTQRGIVVFNTPGANSNAVKELVFAGLLLASRDIYHGIEWCKTQADNDNLAKDVEKQKKNYAGNERCGPWRDWYSSRQSGSSFRDASRRIRSIYFCRQRVEHVAMGQPCEG
ncbi:hypothetical protein [uncultured Dubosiella sp.]|uniref:hypothetical protein n=1 Tax=uncultured Dubosiella sp. TaxID=1937011 RepID=UPI0035218831